MAIGQLFYTSCKKGLSSGMGFQTYSMSKSITDEEREEIEGYCVYIPPDNLPTQPTDEEIGKLFPIAFSSFRLESGKYCVCHSQYTGKDYSGRYGNYFCHILISDKPWCFYPIELYGSTIFRNRLTAEEENALEIEYLPELEEIPVGNIITFNTISNFFKENIVDKRKNFIKIMDALIGYNKNKKRIVFSSCKDSIPFWIGAVQMAFPKKLAQGFSFTTYCYNPEDVGYIVCALDSEGSRFNFRDSQKLFKYTVLNFISQNSEDIICKSSFIKRAEVGYTVSKDVFLPFVDFLEQFEYNILDENIDSSISLYNMVKKGVEKSDIENVKKAVSFAINYKSIDAYIQLFKQLDPKLEQISSQVDIELAEIITKFLFKAGRETNNREHIKKAYEFFFNSIHYLIVDTEEISLEYILSLYEKIRNIGEVSIREFVQVSLNLARINELKTYLEGGKIRHAKFYFKTIVGDIIASNDKCYDIKIGLFRKEDKNITILLNKCLKILLTSPEDILDILSYFKNEYEYFSTIILKIHSNNKSSFKNKEIDEILSDFVVSEEKEWKQKICSIIDKIPDSSDFLFSLYVNELRKNNDKKEFFINYCYEVFYLYDNYRREKFSDALKLYLAISDSENIALEEYKKIIGYMIKNSIISSVDKLVLEKVVTAVEEKINIQNAAEEGYIIEKLKEIKNEYNIKTPCSITELIHIGRIIQNAGIVSKAAHVQELKVDFSNMSVDKYEEYLRWFLSNICVYLTGFREHEKVKKVLFCLKYSDIFYEIYIDTMEDILLTKKYKNALKSYDKEDYEIFLDCLIIVFRNREEMEEEAGRIIDNKIVDILLKSSEKKLDDYNSKFISKTSNLKDKEEIKMKWRYIIRQVKAKNQKKGLLRFFKK